jgi:predicted enzyme related to lactoylglutathione lyase
MEAHAGGHRLTDVPEPQLAGGPTIHQGGSMSGKVVHFEIPFDDGDRARRFYSESFGWQLMPMPEMSYTIVMTGPSDPEKGPTEPGFINGGMFERSEQFPGKAPNIVIGVPSVDEALRKVESAGGTTVTERMPVGDMGFTGYFTDNEGNLIGLWETA